VSSIAAVLNQIRIRLMAEAEQTLARAERCSHSKGRRAEFGRDLMSSVARPRWEQCLLGHAYPGRRAVTCYGRQERSGTPETLIFV
jgi:hypothetical protein